MNPSENLPRETEPGESWLRSMLPAAEQVDGTAIKQRIRVELGERWLKGELRNGDTTRTVVAARNRVHEQLAADQRLDSPVAVNPTADKAMDHWTTRGFGDGRGAGHRFVRLVTNGYARYRFRVR